MILRINGRPYEVGCEDGGEDHLVALAGDIEERVRQVAAGAGAPGETRLMLMAALTLADELRRALADVAAGETREARLRDDLDRLQDRVLSALEAASARLEGMAHEWGAPDRGGDDRLADAGGRGRPCSP